MTYAFSLKNSLSQLLRRYDISIIWVDNNNPIPGSYWGAPEAGIIRNQLYLRNDTPLHSALHESCHYICMDEQRRATLHTDTGGNYDEENAVCYLQIVLSRLLKTGHSFSLYDDMDEWGYTFRLGSAQRWFDEDADDARLWLQRHQILDEHLTPTWKIRY